MKLYRLLQTLVVLVNIGILVPAIAQAPGGLYVGYYMEDPVTNPEDPVPGAIYMNLPAGDSAFSGTMFFTYLGCQTISAGNVSGTKSGQQLVGRWAGPIDGTPQSGDFSGVYDAAAQRYSGGYTVDKGKQFFDLRPCIQYYIAPNGSWELFPIGRSVPATFSLSVAGDSVSWPSVPGAVSGQLALVDTLLATTSATANAVKWQTLFVPTFTTFSFSWVGISPGSQDVVTVALFDAAGQRVAFGSQTFSTPPWTITGTPSGGNSSLSLLANFTIAPADVGRTGSFYIAARLATGDFFFLTPSGFTQYLGGPLPSFSTGALSDRSITVLSGVNVTPYLGTTIFAGYGLNEADLIGNSKYSAIYTVQ